MAEVLQIADGLKAEKYRVLLPQVAALSAGETDDVALMANVSAALRETFGFFWVGFYRVQADELVVGPFQGAPACMRIRYGKGVCGTAWAEGRTVVVPDVSEFPGHIACSPFSRSEIVVPLWRDGRVWAVLDIDSDRPDNFDETDARCLEDLCGEVFPR